jgi:hypothetical protein
MIPLADGKMLEWEAESDAYRIWKVAVTPPAPSTDGARQRAEQDVENGAPRRASSSPVTAAAPRAVTAVHIVSQLASLRGHRRAHAACNATGMTH